MSLSYADIREMFPPDAMRQAIDGLLEDRTPPFAPLSVDGFYGALDRAARVGRPPPEPILMHPRQFAALRQVTIDYWADVARSERVGLRQSLVGDIALAGL